MPGTRVREKFEFGDVLKLNTTTEEGYIDVRVVYLGGSAGDRFGDPYVICIREGVGWHYGTAGDIAPQCWNKDEEWPESR